MVDWRSLLHQKQRDIERVRYEIEALRTAISLLEEANEQPSSPIAPPVYVSTAQAVDESTRAGMADLQTYYPFTRQIDPARHGASANSARP